MSVNATDLANLMYVLNDLLRNPRKVRLGVKMKHKWLKDEFEVSWLAIPIAIGINPNPFSNGGTKEPTLYFVGSGFGHTVSSLALHRITSVKELKHNKGTLLWAGKIMESATPAEKAEAGKSLTAILGL